MMDKANSSKDKTAVESAMADMFPGGSKIWSSPRLIQVLSWV